MKEKDLKSIRLLKSNLRKNKISLEILKNAFELEEKYFLEFLIDIKIEYTASQKEYLRKTIIAKINDKNRWNVSLLLEIATKEGIELPYELCLKQFKTRNKFNDYVILQLITYFTENLKLYYLDELKEAMDNIIYGDSFYDLCKMTASFFMFKITRHPSYLQTMIHLIEFGDSIIKEQIKNELSLPYNKTEYLNCEALEKYREKVQ